MKTISLEETCRFFNGYAFKSKDYVSKGIRIIRIANVQKGYIEDKLPCYYPYDSKAASDYALARGDLLISLTGNVGRVGLMPDNLLPAALNQRVACLRVKDDSPLTREFIYAMLNSDQFEQKAIESSNGVAQKNLSASWLKKYQLPLITKGEQTSFCKRFSIIDSNLSKCRTTASRLDSLIKSRFVEMFGDPVQNSFHWRMAPLGGNAKLINGRAYKQNELHISGKYPVLRVGNFFSNRDWYYSDLELNEKKYCDNGDLLYAWSASFGPKIWDGGKVIYHYHIWKVEVGDAYNKHFLCKLLKYAEKSFLGDTHGIGMLHLTKSGMEEAPFIVPPRDLQDRFADFVQQVD